MPGALTTLPKLVKLSHRDIVQGHFGVDSHDHAAILPHANTELRLLASNQRGIKTADLLECLNSHHRVAATILDVTDGRIPFNVG
jgi:hypothetical protein